MRDYIKGFTWNAEVWVLHPHPPLERGMPGISCMAGEYSHAERLQVSGLLEVIKCSLQLTMQLIAFREGLVTASSRSQQAAEVNRQQKPS